MVVAAYMNLELPATWTRIENVRRDENVGLHDLRSRAARDNGSFAWICQRELIGDRLVLPAAEGQSPGSIQLATSNAYARRGLPREDPQCLDRVARTPPTAGTPVDKPSW